VAFDLEEVDGDSLARLLTPDVDARGVVVEHELLVRHQLITEARCRPHMRFADGDALGQFARAHLVEADLEDVGALAHQDGFLVVNAVGHLAQEVAPDGARGGAEGLRVHGNSPIVGGPKLARL